MPGKIDITSNRYGKWMVIGFSHYKSSNGYWVCMCDCGAVRTMAKKTLNRGKLKPCKCDTISSEVNMIGRKYGQLLVVSLCTINPERKYDFNCICDCGEKTVVYIYNILNGGIQSCGCYYKISNSTHGYATLSQGKTDEYNCWIAMKQRCRDINFDGYYNYGGRGITVCDRWIDSFENFLQDMGLKPTKNHSIERDNVNGNYEPSNCRWATTAEQSINKRNNRWWEYNGKKYIQRDLVNLLGTNSGAFSTMVKKKSFDDTVNYYLNKKNGNRMAK